MAAISGLTIKGIKNVLPNFAKLKLAPTATTPLPNKAPTKLWVVDIGIPIFVAKKTVKAAPIAIEIANAGD